MPSKRPRDDDDEDDRPRRRRRSDDDDDEDDRPRKKRKRKEGLGVATTLGIVFGVLFGVGAILVVILLVVSNKSDSKLDDEVAVKLPAGRVEARGLGTRTQEMVERYFWTLDGSVLMKDVTAKLGTGQRLPRDRFKDIQIGTREKQIFLAEYAKDGLEKYLWYAWTNGSETLLLAFGHSDEHRLMAAVITGPKGTAFRSY
ncbi:MAG TPA: hypothetical protein VKE74_36235 [Gemmataceae bacterium]|nr:hypothetical protein [Gemmataceae bacterium]